MQIGVFCVISVAFSCGGATDVSGQAPPGGADASDAKGKLVAAFTTSGCKRYVECQNPTADQCTPYTEQRVRQGLDGLTWSDADIDKCALSRTTVLGCLDRAACPEIASGMACSDEITAWLDACAPLLDVLAM
jgi:hypothetical protein